MSFLDFAAIKQQVSVRAAIDLLGLRLSEHQSQWRGPCPTCKSGGDRALVITPSKNAFYCFAAHSGGDVIALASHIRAVGMKEAAAFLTGDSVAAENGTSARTGNGHNKLPEERPKEDVRSLKPLSYLELEHEALRAIGLEGETCRHFGAGYAPKGIMRGKLAIPIHDWRTGHLVAYCGYAIRGESNGLSFPKDFDPLLHIFNGDKITDGEVTLMRDPLEVMMAFQNGVGNGIAFFIADLAPEQLQALADLMQAKAIAMMHIA
jgi:CHC2 zinc finger